MIKYNELVIIEIILYNCVRYTYVKYYNKFFIKNIIIFIYRMDYQTKKNEIYLFYFCKIVVLSWSILSLINHFYPFMNILKNYPVGTFGNNLNYVIMFIIGLCLINILFDRNTYLPFLGDTIIPHSLFKPLNNSLNKYDKTDFKKISINVDAPNGINVIWWAASPSNEINKVDKAYGDYMNSGVSEVKDGIGKIEFYYPQKYYLDNTRMLDNHLHYRISYNNGFVSEINTIKL